MAPAHLSPSSNGRGRAQLTYTSHALDVMERRSVRPEWVERAVTAPQRRVRDPDDWTLEWFFCRITESDGKVLRVVVNTESDPWRVVTAYFDRSMRGGL